MKKYVITGSTSGIGRALLEEFAKDGKVFAGFRNSKYETELAGMKNVIPFFIDMEKTSIIDGAAVFIKRQAKKLDLLINVAGCVMAGAKEKMAISKLRKEFEVNTFSQLRCTQKIMPLL